MRSTFVLVCVFLATLASSQSDRGTITGTISDPGGAVVASAPIQAKNVATGALYDAASTNTGNYTLAELPAGTYELSVSVPGFKRYVRQGLEIQVAQIARIDIVLEVGTASESVTVTEAAPLLNTENGELSHNVASQTLDELPVLGVGANFAGTQGVRNPNAVLVMIPGTYWVPNNGVRVNGAPANTQAFRVEGQDATDGGTPGVPAQLQPGVDAIQEITVQTSNYAAEYGQVGGGVFNVTMRSGSNQLHGSAYEYLVNEAFNSGTPFLDLPAGAGNPRPRQRRYDYGGTVGGPVWIPKIYNGHDKTFFFFNLERFQEHQQVNNLLETVPTAAYRAGNFATAITTGKPLTTDPLGRPVMEGEIFDPATTRTISTGQVVRDPFAGNIIDPSRFDPVAVKIQSYIPQPLGANALGVANNYIPTFTGITTTQITSFKIDQVVGAKGKLSYYFSRNALFQPISTAFGGGADGLPDPITTAVGSIVPTWVTRLNYDHSLAPTMLLHFGAGFQYVDFGIKSVTADGSGFTNYDSGKELGLPGTINRFFPSISGLMTAVPSNGGMKAMGSSFDSHSYTEKPTFTSSFTWVKSNHTYKFGAEFRTEGYPAVGTGGVNGSYAFSTATTSEPYLQTTTVAGGVPGFGYASFLLGLVNNGNIAYPVQLRLGKSQTGIYAQDTWKITRKLTLDYGLRYDYSTYLKEQYGRASVFSPAVLNPSAGNIPGAVMFEGDGPGHCNCQFAHNYPWAFGPRLGLAYQINAKTVFRGGFGIVYAGTPDNNNSAGGFGLSNPFSTPSFGIPVMQLSTGIPPQYAPRPFPDINAGIYPFNNSIPNSNPPGGIDPNAGRPPRQYQWSAGFQREIFRNLAIDAAYVGNRGIWWIAPGLINVNALSNDRLKAFGININNQADQALLLQPIGSAAAAQRGLGLPYAGYPASLTVAQALRPFPQFGTIQYYWSPLGDTWYNSLQLKATQRLTHGLSFLTTFTWSKSETIGAETVPNPGTTGGASINDVFNRQNNKYLSQYDTPLAWNASLNYITPRLNTNKVLSWVARDWTYGLFLQYKSGLPLLVPAANNNLGSYLFQSTFANRVPGQPLFLQDLNCHCFDPQTTIVLNPNAWVDPPVGQFGTSAAYYGDYRRQRHPIENMNLGRTWRVKERTTINIRMEFTNVFNRSVFSDPASTNAKAVVTHAPNGNITGGFGSIAATGTIAASGLNLQPRSGTLIGRITF
ncbi:MAG: TonB-dependent receptor [Bryobacterales bacterium]|nr:TonB-dependent receptor [Bryobacterales bacterium]MBV9399534.1 TonB-dependent receptor [Bryobacterales bacterium]